MLSRMGERVAGLEARLESLKSDTEHTRGSIHAINGELQKVVITEQRFLLPWLVALGAMSVWAWEHLAFHP